MLLISQARMKIYPYLKIALKECISLEISESARNEYSAVIAEWQDINEAKIKSIKVGSGENVYKIQKMIMKLLKKRKQNSMSFKKVD